MTSTAARRTAPSASAWTARNARSTFSAGHSDELRKALGQYLAHARRVGGTARSAARTRRGSAAVDTAKVREWAKGQGIEVKDRGRVPVGVVAQY
jgi:hypothetical protein